MMYFCFEPEYRGYMLYNIKENKHMKDKKSNNNYHKSVNFKQY
jgi:hypothetical protein